MLHTYTSAAGGNSVINHLAQPASFKLYSKAIVESGAYDQGAANFSDVSRPFPSWNRSILTEIYLCHACSCQEILRTETAGTGGLPHPALVPHQPHLRAGGGAAHPRLQALGRVVPPG